jgi:hypothetical protein
MMMTYMRSRWSDNDRYVGPFTFARDGSQRFALVLQSAGDEGDDSSLRLSAFGLTVISALPAIIKPYRTKVHPGSAWDAATVERLGRDWYWDVDRRRFGFSLTEGFLQVFHGRQTGDSSTDRTWGYFLPWTQWRHVRHSFYGLSGEHVATIPDTGKGWEAGGSRWDREREIADSTPTSSFAFADFDGDQLTATTRIEEREWRFGERKWKWLSLFRKPKIRRSLDVRFSGETGKRKGSWKGGTIGHSIDMLPGELHEAAFRRYCAEHAMTFAKPEPVL